MIFGDVKTFAFEAEESVRLEGWIYIHLRMWIGGRSFGNYEDDVALKVTISKLTGFLRRDSERHEPSLDDVDTAQVLKELFDSIVLTIPPGVDALAFDEPEMTEPRYPRIIARFHLHEVGASAFLNRTAVIFLRLADGRERFVWREIQTNEAGEVICPPGSFAAAAVPFLKWGGDLLASSA